MKILFQNYFLIQPNDLLNKQHVIIFQCELRKTDIFKTLNINSFKVKSKVSEHLNFIYIFFYFKNLIIFLETQKFQDKNSTANQN